MLAVAGGAEASTAWIYTANQANTVTPIEVATNKSFASFGFFDSPRGIAVTPDGKTLYVTNYETNNGFSQDTVTPVDLATSKRGVPIIVGFEPGAHPFGVAVTPDGKTVYVVNSNEVHGSVTKIDVATNEPLAEIKVPGAPKEVAFTPDGKTAYVTVSATSTVMPIDVATNKPGAEIKVGPAPRGIAVTPDGKTAYVTNAGSNTVTPIDVATNKPGAEIKVGGGPNAVAVTPDGKTAYVASGVGTVTPIDVATNKPGAEIIVGGGPEAIAVTPDGKTVYVTPSGGSTVKPIDVATNKPGAEIFVGGGPDAIAITRIYQTPTVTKVFATSGPVTGDRVVTITGTNLGVARAVEFGGIPARSYVVNEAGTELAAVSPVRELSGIVDVTVRTPGGTSAITAKDHYKYLPVITSIHFNSGPVGGGTQVEIIGAGFSPEAGIFFGTTLAENAECFSLTFCLAESPPHAKGKVEIKLKFNGLTSAKSSAALFTYF